MQDLTISQDKATEFVDALHGEDPLEPTADAADAVWQLSMYVDLDAVVDRLEGREGGLRPSKPTAEGDTGLEQYLWRMARFHAGYDTSMPVTASIWLQTWIDEQTQIEASVSGVMNAEGKAVTSFLEAVVDLALVELGESPAKAARTWEASGVFG